MRTTTKTTRTIVLAPILVITFATGLVAAPKQARAGAIAVDVGAGAAATTWAGDGALYSTLRAGYRFSRFFELHVGTRNGRAIVDDRHLGYLNLGGGLWHDFGPVRPFLRADFVHQHEEPDVSVQADRRGSAFGVADGIRHRGGYAAGAGLEIPVRLKTHANTAALFGAEFTATTFPDQRGPSAYWFGGLTFGISWDL